MSTRSISPDQSCAWYEGRGVLLGEQDDDIARCSHCGEPTDPDELIVLDGQDVDLPCLIALTGEDPFAPDNARDIGSTSVAVTLLAGIFGGLLFLALLTAGQAAMCTVHATPTNPAPLSYCDGYEAQR
jgi:hypothetical protein